MIFMEMLMFIAMSSGSLLSSYVYAATNAAVTQAISAACVTLVTLFIILYLPESLHIQKQQDEKNAAGCAEQDVPISAYDMQIKSENLSNDEKNEKNDKNEKNEINEKLANGLKPLEIGFDKNKQKDIENQKIDPKAVSETTGLFSPKHLKDMLVSFCKPREYHAREIIWLVTLTMFVTMFVVGKYIHTYLPYQQYTYGIIYLL